jgi:Icc-related predicted phosphoesterase
MLSNLIIESPHDKETVLVVAGDIGLFSNKPTWFIPVYLLAARFRYVIFIGGNHFFYHSNISDNYKKQVKSSLSKSDNIIFLEDSMITIDDVTFIGANLWTNFYNRNPISMLTCQNRMSDFHLIRKSNDKIITPDDVVDIHNFSKEFIFNNINPNSKNVVITHHAPSTKSIPEKYLDDANLNGGYITDLEEEIINSNIDLWIHGHTHESFDYDIGNTRIICNPYGYQDMMTNHDFDPELAVKII